MWSPLLFLALALGDGDLTEDFEGAGSESWERVVSDLHPPYNTVERVHDPEQAKSGNQFLHLRTLGGSTAVRRSPRHPWPVEAGRPYRASVWVRLSGTKRNGASLSLTWLNAAGDSVSERRSPPLSRTEGWTRISLEIPAAPAGATGVLPGLHFDGPDVRGFCDFDLLQIDAVERLEIRPAGRSIAAFTTEEYPRFVLSPAGLPVGVHAITATLSLSGGETIVRTATLDFPAGRSVAVDFPPAPAGVHSLATSVDGHEARKTLAVLVTPPGRTPSGIGPYERTESRLHDSIDRAVRDRILNPQKPLILDAGAFDDEGQPTAGYFALLAADQILAGAEPIPDPGLFPSSVRVAAFRQGPSVTLALWSESGEVEVPILLNEGAVVQPALAAPHPLRPGEKVRVAAMPLYIAGVDPLLAELRLELSASELPLQLSPSRMTLRLRNRSRVETPRDLEVELGDLPAGWRASSRRFKIASLPPEGIHEETLDLIVPASETERPVDLKFEVRFGIQGREVTMQNLRRVTLKSRIRIESAVNGKVLSVRVVNGSEHAMTLSVRSRVPGLAERLDLVRELSPGARSKPLDFPLQGPGSAEIYVQESGDDRALSRRLLPLP
ncbi:MAG: hypothetical protein JO332_00415 [Planctomycetaceae bacterium]|nr:hypothetical protein [Planctomycetaceae bacterium]